MKTIIDYEKYYTDDETDNCYIECKQIIDFVPNIVDGKDKTLLYIGANCDRAFALDLLLDIGYIVDIIEICKKNINCLVGKYKIRNLIFGDIKDEQNIINNYDVIFWYHGPEHVRKEDFCTLNLILEKKSKMIVLGCPNNDYHLYDDNINVYETHMWKIKPEDLHCFGYNTSNISRNSAVDNIVAWKIME